MGMSMAEALEPAQEPLYIAGHRGLVGSALLRACQARGIATVTRTHAELDLRDQAAVRAFFAEQRIGSLVLAAARVGGIHANATRPADFIADNLQIQTNVLLAAHEAGIQRLIFLGSSCIYPRDAEQPIREEALLTGPLEPTNAAYAVAKIAGVQLCDALRRQHGRDYRCLMPTNLYGPGDNDHATDSHVIPALLRRFREAKARGEAEVVVWGSGRPLREFLHADDLADACLHLLAVPQARWCEVLGGVSHLNVGSGEELSIAELGRLIAEVVGFRGALRFDATKPDGTPRKRLDNRRLDALGWAARRRLSSGLVGLQ